jgi:hypothetical protein
MAITYKTFVCYGWASPVEPRILVAISWSNKSRSCHLLGIKSKSNASWTILSLRNCARDGFGLKAISFSPRIKKVFFDVTDFQIQTDTILLLECIDERIRSAVPYTGHSFSQQTMELRHLFESQPNERFSDILLGLISWLACFLEEN